jgi:hypothetical protein
MREYYRLFNTPLDDVRRLQPKLAYFLRLGFLYWKDGDWYLTVSHETDVKLYSLLPMVSESSRYFTLALLFHFLDKSIASTPKQHYCVDCGQPATCSSLLYTGETVYRCLKCYNAYLHEFYGVVA